MKNHTCPSCGKTKTTDQMKDAGAPAKGRAPRCCRSCREARPDDSWCGAHREWHPLESFGIESKTGKPKGSCKDHYNEERAGRVLKTCRLCLESLPVRDFRPDGRAQPGRPPAFCNQCRSNSPHARWCFACDEVHDKDDFHPSEVRPGTGGRCKAATQDRNWKRNTGGLTIKCPSCKQAKRSLEFGGMGKKEHVCQECKAGHSGQRWCMGHHEWMADSQFSQRVSRWCRPCLAAKKHGVTVRFVMDINGSTTPECAVCGRLEGLCVDHDHSHCPGPVGCQECVRGYLCQGCNMAEGRLGSAEVAESLAAYMRKHQDTGSPRRAGRSSRGLPPHTT